MLRFINSNFPTDVALVAWCRFVGRWLYDKIGQAPRIVRVDETDILDHYRVIVMAVPFRKRAIPIYWKIYRKDAFDKSYHSTEKLKLNLYVFKDARHKEPLYLVSNSLRNTQLYLTYRRRMQIEACFRDIKTLFGFRQRRLKQQKLPRVALLWFLVCISYAICFLHFEKAAERWIRAYNTRSTKTYSLIFVIKRTLETTWAPDIFLDPYFPIADWAG